MISREQDKIIRPWVERVWALEDTGARLEKINKFKLPYKRQMLAVLKGSIISGWRYGRARGRILVAQGKKTGRKVKVEARVFEAQEFAHRHKEFDSQGAAFIAAAQELTAGESAYAQVSKTYSAWVDKLGDDLWEKKVKAVKTPMTRGIENGWGLRARGEYVKAGKKVSAFEATGGVGGKANVLPGYSFIETAPGLLNEMSKALAPFSVPGWQVERIARTEHTRAMNDGLMSIYAEEESVVSYEFDAIIDARVCPECAMMNGTILAQDDPRLSYYEPPVHANCRCELLPIFAWELVEPSLDLPRRTTLYDKEGKGFKVDYIPSRINPDFLSTIRPANDAAGIKSQLMTKRVSENLRAGFVPTPAKESFATWMHPRSDSLAKETEGLLGG